VNFYLFDIRETGNIFLLLKKGSRLAALFLFTGSNYRV